MIPTPTETQTFFISSAEFSRVLSAFSQKFSIQKNVFLANNSYLSVDLNSREFFIESLVNDYYDKLGFLPTLFELQLYYESLLSSGASKRINTTQADSFEAESGGFIPSTNTSVSYTHLTLPTICSV